MDSGLAGKSPRPGMTECFAPLPTLHFSRKLRRVSDSRTLFAALRETADADVVTAIERAVAAGAGRDLARINVLAFAAVHGLDEEKAIAAFLHAAKLGMFELFWDVLCPSCRGVLHVTETLQDVHREPYACSLCSRSFEVSLDETIEIVFTVSPRLPKIAAHEPHTLPFWDYYRQVFWSSAVDVSDADLEKLIAEFTLDARVLEAGDQATVTIDLPEGWVILFEPVSHFGHYIKVAPARTADLQELTVALKGGRAPTATTELRSGPLRLTIANRTALRALPVVWNENRSFDALVGKRRPHLTAKRIFTNQTFRDLYRTDTLAVDQGLKIVSLTFLFTDLKGSTELYARTGDLVAYELVRQHFLLLNKIVAQNGGAVVKTIGDAVIATFPAPERALAAAFAMREAIASVGVDTRKEDLILKIGIHEGPSVAVMLNDRLDYFGQTVNIAARVQGLAVSHTIFATKPVVDHPQSAAVLAKAGITPVPQNVTLKGVAGETAVYEIP
jgi:class 3 adenylate cyclase